MRLNKTNKEDLRGVFFIVKGQYRRNCGKSYVNAYTGEVGHLGGYDPSEEDTREWYMVLDNVDFHCICCGSSFEKAKKSIYNAIKNYRTLDRYKKRLSEMDKSQRVSKPMRCLYQAVYDNYGDFYSEYIEEQEDLAYGDTVFKTPLQRSKDIKKKTSVKKLGGGKVTEPKTKENTTKTLKKVKPLKRAVKKLRTV